MADILVPVAGDLGAKQRFRDMGDGSWAPVVASGAGAGAAGYPAGATPLQASSGTTANAVASATLPAAAGKTTYITGVQLTGGGATAAGIQGLSITGLKNGQITYVIVVPAGAQVPLPPMSVQFNPPLPASAANTAIVASLPALGAGNLAVGLSIQGFQA